MKDQICRQCRHKRGEHEKPPNAVYYRCSHYIGHPWDDECECREWWPDWIEDD